ncbi:MAG: hypothetical protein PUJ72_04515, partial [Eubacteriales bacterium]|nr:hypothetical protein [Eubacteriales bacterium]
RNNPIALTTDMETTVQAAVGKLLAEGVIKQNEAVKSDNPNDWRLEKNVKTIIETLSTKYDVVVYANYIIVDANLFAPHVHTWETAWAFDETHHWHKCVGCDEITGKAEHVFGADGKCGVCGAIKPTEAHTHVYEKNVADKYLKSAADCTQPAVYYFSCACGEVGTQTFEYGTALGHNFVAGNVTTQPTCTIQGRRTYTCTRCGMTKTEAIPALGHTYGSNGKCIRCNATKPGQGGHTHKYSEVLKKAATCTTEAEYQLVCSCGEVGSQPYTKGTPLGHAWDDGKVTTPATCKDAGVKTFTCTRCNTTKTETIAKTSEHTWNEGEITKQPTYVSEGEKTYICTVCGETKVEVLDKKQAIIASEEDFKKAFEEAMKEEAKTLRVKLTNDLDLAKIGACLPVFSLGEDYHTATLMNGTLEIDLNGHNICFNASDSTLTLSVNSKLILRNGTMKGFLCEMEGNAEAYLENVTLNDAGLSLTYAGIGISAETDWLAHIGSAILELNNCKAICTSDNGEERFDITKDKLNKCCSAKAPPFFSDEPKFWAKIFVNEVRAEIYGNQLEY